MITRDAAQAGIPAGTQAIPQDVFESAMDDLIAATMALASSMAELEFGEGSRLRRVVERALGRAQLLGEQLPDGGQRSEALHQLAEMHAIATRLLMSAPAPSAVAIAGVKAGDATVWNEEARAWIASRPPRSGDQTVALRARLDGRNAQHLPHTVCDALREMRSADVASQPGSLRDPGTRKVGA